MIVSCEKCATKFRVPDDKVTEKGVRVKCTRCLHIFRVTKADGAPTDEHAMPVPPAASAPSPPAPDNDPFAAFEDQPSASLPPTKPSRPPALAKPKPVADDDGWGEEKTTVAPNGLAEMAFKESDTQSEAAESDWASAPAKSSSLLDDIPSPDENFEALSTPEREDPRALFDMPKDEVPELEESAPSELQAAFEAPQERVKKFIPKPKARAEHQKGLLTREVIASAVAAAVLLFASIGLVLGMWSTYVTKFPEATRTVFSGRIASVHDVVALHRDRLSGAPIYYITGTVKNDSKHTARAWVRVEMVRDEKVLQSKRLLVWGLPTPNDVYQMPSVPSEVDTWVGERSKKAQAMKPLESREFFVPMDSSLTYDTSVKLRVVALLEPLPL